MDSRKVDMIRLERPEEVYDRAELFGRDVGDVFRKKTSEGVASASVVQNNNKFISESELDEIKKQRGALQDEAVGSMKPLSEVLRENKAAKDEEFKNVWKNMKIGKNRPLEADELEYYDRLAQDEAGKELDRRKEEEMELEEFRRQAQASSIPEAPHSGAAGGQASVGPYLPPPSLLKRPAPAIKPLLKIKPKDYSMIAKKDNEPASKKAKGEKTIEEEGSGPLGLLADYDDDSS